MKAIRALRQWHWIRITALLAAMFFLFDFARSQDLAALFFGLFIGLQAVFNVGCVAGACTPSKAESKPIAPFLEDDKVEVEFLNGGD